MSAVREEEQLHREGAADFVAIEIVGRTPWQLFWVRFRRDRVAFVALGFIVLLVLVAIFAGPITSAVGHPPDAQFPQYLDSFGLPSGPSSRFLFGLDQVGRDVFSRMLYGARASLEVALIATAISVSIGVVLGMTAGYFRGWVDTVISRLIDITLAFPILLLALGIASACSLGNGCVAGLVHPGLGTVVVAIVVINWTYIARIIRGQVLSMKEREYIEAARSLGAGNWRILFVDILPNVIAPAIVFSTLLLPVSIVAEASLSFLGVGIAPPTADWGE
ncbi:MAG: ABC transporter permease, partial [Gaiellaceae bacterium]